MKAKHTPGPWRCDDEVEMDDVKPRSSFSVGFAAGSWADLTYSQKRDAWAANAALIAAAPDLLAALKALVDSPRCPGRFFRDVDRCARCQAVSAARALIARVAPCANPPRRDDGTLIGERAA